MTTIMRLASMLPGLALLTGSWFAFGRILPRNGVVNPWLTTRFREELAVLAFVAGVAIGFGLIMQGLAGAMR